MGVKKAATKKKSGGVLGKVAKKAKTVVSAVTGKKVYGKRRSRVTPEKLAKKILILRLQKRLYRMKYGGR